MIVNRHRRYRHPCTAGTEFSDTGIDVVPNLSKYLLPVIPTVYAVGMPRYVPYRTHPWTLLCCPTCKEHSSAKDTQQRLNLCRGQEGSISQVVILPNCINTSCDMLIICTCAIDCLQHDQVFGTGRTLQWPEQALSPV